MEEGKFNNSKLSFRPQLFKSWITLSTRSSNHYPKDKYYEDQLRYPLDGDLSNGTTGARSTIIIIVCKC